MKNKTQENVRTAKLSFSNKGHPVQCNWPKGIGLQCGEKGVVFSNEGSYATAFFEAFPKRPSCFVRGEGNTLEEAERDAFKKWTSILECEAHEFERRGREDGYAYCKHCSYSSTVLEPLTKCETCKEPAHDGQDLMGHQYCDEHYYELDPNVVFEKQDEVKRSIEAEVRAAFIETKKRRSLLKTYGFIYGHPLFIVIERKMEDESNRIRRQKRPLFGKQEMSFEELEDHLDSHREERFANVLTELHNKAKDRSKSN